MFLRSNFKIPFSVAMTTTAVTTTTGTAASAAAATKYRNNFG